jgi:hypothetical protein
MLTDAVSLHCNTMQGEQKSNLSRFINEYENNTKHHNNKDIFL